MNYRRLLPVFLLIAATASAQEIRWTQTSGPPGGLVYALLATGDHLFASAGVLFRSTNRGDQWSKASPIEASDITNRRVHEMVRDSSGRILAATYDYVYVSTTGGANWTRHAVAPGYPRAIAISSDGALFVQTQTLRRITDDTVVTVADLGVNSYDVTTFAAGRNGMMYAIADTTSVYRSTDDGMSWQFASVLDSVAPSVYGMEVLANGSVVALTSKGMYVSHDEAASWIADTSSIRERKVFAGVEHGDALYVGTQQFGVFRSTDIGGTWTEMNYGFDNTNITDLASSPDGKLFAGTYQGVYSSTDGGSTWQFTSNGIAATGIQAIRVTADDRLLAGTASGIFATTDRGASWRTLNHGLNERDVRSIVFDSVGTLYALTSTPSLFTSTNGGELWTRVGPIADYPYVSHLTVGPGGVLFAASLRVDGMTNIIRSTDRGTSWTVERELPGFLRGLAIADDGELIAIPPSQSVYRSTAHGTSWDLVADGTLADELWAGAADGRGRAYVAAKGGVYRSSDDGRTWNANEFAPMDGNCYSVGASPSGYVLTYCGGETYASFDGGETYWESSEGMNGLATWGYAFATDGTVYAATNFGVFRGELTASAVRDDADASMRAIRIYPHPVQGRARLDVAMPSPSHVTVTLHSALGELTATLYNGAASAGTLSLALDDLAPGTYACHVRRGGDVVTRVFIVE